MDPKAHDTRPAELSLHVHLRGPRVQLVPADPKLHLENYLNWLNDAEVTRWVSRSTPLSRLAEERWFQRMAEDERHINWGVHDERGQHIGATGLHGIDWQSRKALSGIMIGDKTKWGMGYGTEVMQVRTAYAFETLGLHRVGERVLRGQRRIRHLPGASGLPQDRHRKEVPLARRPVA